MTTEPQESVWLFPPASSADENGLVAVGADITPSTLLAAYRNGLFPMPLQEEGIIGWIKSLISPGRWMSLFDFSRGLNDADFKEVFPNKSFKL